jgi:hypothetical protein
MGLIRPILCATGAIGCENLLARGLPSGLRILYYSAEAIELRRPCGGALVSAPGCEEERDVRAVEQPGDSVAGRATPGG